MDVSFLESEEFKRLESEYKFLTHARERLLGKGGELERGPMVILDLETTGLDPVENEIIEIGALKVESGEVKSIFNRLVKPGKPLTEEITRITGITDEMLADAPRIKEVFPEFIGFVGGSPVMAHNVSFDIPFIKEKLRSEMGKGFNNRTICTLELSRILLPGLENHKLHTIARHFGIQIYARHRAIGDVEATFQVWQKLLEKLKERGISSMADLDKFVSSNLRQTPF